MANSVVIKEKAYCVGDTIKVFYKFKEGGTKEKAQAFEGLIISIRGISANKTFTVRKVTKDKIGVERIFPINSPFIEKIDLVKKGNVKRSKIYFVRGLSDKILAEKIS